MYDAYRDGIGALEPVAHPWPNDCLCDGCTEKALLQWAIEDEAAGDILDDLEMQNIEPTDEGSLPW